MTENFPKLLIFMLYFNHYSHLHRFLLLAVFFSFIFKYYISVYNDFSIIFIIYLSILFCFILFLLLSSLLSTTLVLYFSSLSVAIYRLIFSKSQLPSFLTFQCFFFFFKFPCSFLLYYFPLFPLPLPSQLFCVFFLFLRCFFILLYLFIFYFDFIQPVFATATTFLYNYSFCSLHSVSSFLISINFSTSCSVFFLFCTSSF